MLQDLDVLIVLPQKITEKPRVVKFEMTGLDVCCDGRRLFLLVFH
jgi:hypothetical protein